MGYKPGNIEEYEARHNHRWPGLADAMRVAGVSNYMRPWQRVHILVNCAAILRRTELSDLDSATFENDHDHRVTLALQPQRIAGL
jgi:L-rhamnose mutarotase